MDLLLTVVPTIIVVALLMAFFIWLSSRPPIGGGDPRSDELSERPMRDSTWMRQGGGFF